MGCGGAVPARIAGVRGQGPGCPRNCRRERAVRAGHWATGKAGYAREPPRARRPAVAGASAEPPGGVIRRSLGGVVLRGRRAAFSFAVAWVAYIRPKEGPMSRCVSTRCLVLSSGIIDPIGSLVPFPRQAAVRRRCRRIVDAPPTHRGGGTSDPAGGPPRPLVVVAHPLRCASIAAARAPSQKPRRAVQWGREFHWTVLAAAESGFAAATAFEAGNDRVRG